MRFAQRKAVFKTVVVVAVPCLFAAPRLLGSSGDSKALSDQTTQMTAGMRIQHIRRHCQWQYNQLHKGSTKWWALGKLKLHYSSLFEVTGWAPVEAPANSRGPCSSVCCVLLIEGVPWAGMAPRCTRGLWRRIGSAEEMHTNSWINAPYSKIYDRQKKINLSKEGRCTM